MPTLNRAPPLGRRPAPIADGFDATLRSINSLVAACTLMLPHLRWHTGYYDSGSAATVSLASWPGALELSGIPLWRAVPEWLGK